MKNKSILVISTVLATILISSCARRGGTTTEPSTSMPTSSITSDSQPTSITTSAMPTSASSSTKPTSSSSTKPTSSSSRPTSSSSTKPTTSSSSTSTTVPPVTEDEYTILLYISGNDLEASYGYATEDIKEILAVSNQPDNVNIVIQTGGAKSWKSTYGISSKYNQRYHVENKQLVCDDEQVYSSYISMGKSSTLQDFIEWGLTTYPAKKTGLVFWNHGGAMDGCCYDQKNNNDPLINSEVQTALKNAFSNLGRKDTLEFIGYDCCLMQVQDIAEFNSKYFNYMVASQESEEGEGWYYTTWVKNLYSHKDTETILKSICDSFLDNVYGDNQTLSVLDLSKMSNYKTNFDALSSSLSSMITSSSSWDTLTNALYSATTYGEEAFDVFDVGSVINVMQSSSVYKTRLATELNDLSTSLSNLVKYNKYGSYYSSKRICSGLSMYCPLTADYYGYLNAYSTSTNETNFSTWKSLCNKYI